MLTLVWSCIGCARYGGHRVGWGGACWRWFEVASDVHATVDIGLVPSLGGRSAENFACHFATWSMWRCRSVRWSKWKANESSLEHNCSIRCGAIWKSVCPKSWAVMKDWAQEMLHGLSSMCDPFSFAGIRKWIWQMHWPKELQSIEDKCPKTWPRRKKRGVDRHYTANWTWCTCPYAKNGTKCMCANFQYQ